MIYKPQITHTYDGYKQLVAELTHLLTNNKELEIHISHLSCEDVGPYIVHVFAPIYHVFSNCRPFENKVLFYAKKKDYKKITVINTYLNSMYIRHNRTAHRITING
jgi:hypothetical protein